MQNIKVESHNVEVTTAMKKHINEHVKKVASKFDLHIVENISVHVEVDNHHSHINKVKMIFPVKGNDIVVEGVGSDMYTTVSETANKCQRQLRRHKDKLSKH
jgi:putative sigma-54 modulation protein